jgi:hypothetical protein
MNATQTHFVAICPNCSSKLRVKRIFLGEPIVCKQCGQPFPCAEADQPSIADFGESAAGASSPVDRIVVACPSCQATLRVRRAYIGQGVVCNHCERTLLVSPPEAFLAGSALSGPWNSPAAVAHPFNGERDHGGTGAAHEAIPLTHDRLASENQRLLTEYDRLQVAHQELQAEHGRLTSESQELLAKYGQMQAEHGRLGAEYERIHAELTRVTADVESVRDQLGDVAPGEVRTMVEERAWLKAEVERLRNENDTLRNEQSARDRAARAEVEQREADRAAARAAVDRLAGLLEQRDTELDAARADLGRLDIDRRKALDEAEQLRTILGERERAFQDEGDQLRAEVERLRVERDRLRAEDDRLQVECDQLRSGVEDLRRTLEQEARADRDEMDRVAAELAGLAERNQQLQEECESTQQLCKEYQDRNQELLADLARLESQSSSRMHEEPWPATERSEGHREALAGLWENAGYAGSTPSQPTTSATPRPAMAHELQAVRADVEDLRRRITDSECLQHEMAAILRGMRTRVRMP